MQTYIKRLWYFLLGCLICILLFAIFFFAQRYNYQEPDQVYFMGTKACYFFIAIFLTVVTFFLFSFIKHRKDHVRLKHRFIAFSVFYLLCGILVILSFDNYLVITKKGLTYNTFFQLNAEEIRPWSEIEEARISCKMVQTSKKEPEVRFTFLIIYENGPVINLNHWNSPLYEAKEFQSLYNALIQHQVPIQIQETLSPELADKYPFYAALCNPNRI